MGGIGSGSKAKEMVGLKFGSLTTIEHAGYNKHKHILWRFSCDCGNELIAPGIDVRRGHTKSCGCEKLKALVVRVRKHGASKTRPYEIWSAMIARCESPGGRSYSYYGGRGIRVCSRWKGSYENFISDMGPPPTGYSLERVDNSKGYSPENCVWADRVTQANNKRSNRQITMGGSTFTMANLARHLGIPYGNLRSKINRGVREIGGIGLEIIK